VALWFALDTTTTRHRLIAWAVLGLACAMGFMTKGFLAWALPVLIAVPYMLWQRRLGSCCCTARWRWGGRAGVPAVGHGDPSAGAGLLALFLLERTHSPLQRRQRATRAAVVVFPADSGRVLPALGRVVAQYAATGLKQKRQPSIGFLALWLLLPLGFFSLSNGKLPTYIMPCLLPLALLMGHTLVDLLNRSKARALCLNGVINAVIGLAAMVGLIYLQVARPLYGHSHAEMFSLSLAFIVLLVWVLAHLLQAVRPLTLWAMPALGIGVLVILLPASMPAQVTDNEMPDQFVLEHLDELQQTQALLSNTLDNASALAWRLKRPT
jgi:4-amino-4-deoxy-L-arabinose transferase